MKTVLLDIAYLMYGALAFCDEAPAEKAMATREEIVVILPSQTPYDWSFAAREAYLSSYEAGYRHIATGKLPVSKPLEDDVLRKAASSGLRAGYEDASAQRSSRIQPPTKKLQPPPVPVPPVKLDEAIALELQTMKVPYKLRERLEAGRHFEAVLSQTEVLLKSPAK